MSFTQLISLNQMRETVRRQSARYTEVQMTTAKVDYYINLAYTIRFPAQFKNLKLTKPYVFTTIPNVDTYDFVYEAGLVDNPALPPGNRAIPGNVVITPPAYCQGYLLRYYQDKLNFYNLWPKLSVNQQLNQGDGSSGPYTGTIPSTPFLRAQLDIFGNVTEAAVIISSFDDSGFNYVISDVPQANSNVGNLVDPQGNVVGTVNYFTGAYTFTVSNSGIIPAGANIFFSVVPYQSSRPTDILFSNQQLILRPVPQQVYQVELQISQQPTQLIASNQAPELDEWYLLLCALAVDLIYNEFPDPEGKKNNDEVLEKQICEAQRRTLKQLGTQRAQTIFSGQNWNRNQMQNFDGSAYSGN